MAKNKPGRRSKSAERTQPINAQHEKMLEWLKTVRFRKKIFGGVDEQDVWRRLNELNALYESALVAERARYDALLEQARAESDPVPDDVPREPRVKHKRSEVSQDG